MSSLPAVLKAWREVLPEDCVLTGDRLAPYRVNCLALERSIPAALQPVSEAQVVQIVKIASRHRAPLYPISTGHNWGYGSALPAADHCTIVDLSRMNRILHMDAGLGLISLEPGVTQKQLYDYLEAGALEFFVPTTGAGPTASIIGNALERGFGMTPEKDHFGAVSSIRAVLPDGEIYQPYMSELGAVSACGVWKWGIGPYVDGLFTQGNFGIVTAMQLSLVRRPEHSEVYGFTQTGERNFPGLVETCREMLADLKGPVGSIKFINRRQVEMMMGTPKLGFGLSPGFDWIGFGVIYCKRSLIRALRSSIKQALRAHTSGLVFINQDRLNRLKALRTVAKLAPSWAANRLVEPLDRFQHVLDIINGVPRGLELGIVYQHVRFDPQRRPVDPVRDGVGIIWYAPVIPLQAEVVEKMIGMVKSTLGKYSFNESLSITTLSESCSMGIIPIIYKRPAEKDKAHQCFNELWQRGAEIGCYPYRINIAAMERLTDTQNSVFWSTVARIKAALDPHGILAPGRYCPVDRSVP
jgi:FAD/FMN-containing dehydrogenase